MTDRINETNDALGIKADAAVKPTAERVASYRTAARLSETHYDWMDFHSIPELPQEW